MIKQLSLMLGVFLLMGIGFSDWDITAIYDNSTQTAFDLKSDITLIYNAYNDSVLVNNTKALQINCPLLTDEVFPYNFTSNDSIIFTLSYSISEFPDKSFTCIISNSLDSDFNETFTYTINPLNLKSGLIDELSGTAVNIVYYGFEISSGILKYIKDNYVQAIAGLIVLGILLGLIVSGGAISNPLKDLK